jgi:hypothetical protein
MTDTPVKITLSLSHAEATALLHFLRRVNMGDAVLEKANEKLRVALRGAVDPDWRHE